MKKVILISITVLASLLSANAQGVDFGIKAGANFSTFSDAKGLENRTGLVAGLFGGVKFNDKLALQADLLYSQQGADFDLGGFELDYINVPVVFKYFLVQGLNIQFGPQFGFVVKEEGVLSSGLLNTITDDLAGKNFDLSGVVGVGYDFPLGLRAEARYNFGLSNVDIPNDVTNLLSESTGGKNSVFTVSLGYSFL